MLDKKHVTYLKLLRHPFSLGRFLCDICSTFVTHSFVVAPLTLLLYILKLCETFETLLYFCVCLNVFKSFDPFFDSG